MNDRDNRRQPTTDEILMDIRDEVRAQTDALIKIANAMEEQSRANEVPLYCPPTDFCDGGFRLYRHKEEYWKKDGKDADRLYHALPEERWFKFTGEGAFQGSTVKNHNVWRSQAVTEGSEDDGAGVYDDEPARAAEPENVTAEDWWTHLMNLGRRAQVTNGALATITRMRENETVRDACARWLNDNAAGETIADGNQMLIDLATGIEAVPSGNRR